jgi:hypothetical protein
MNHCRLYFAHTYRLAGFYVKNIIIIVIINKIINKFKKNIIINIENILLFIF